MVNFNAGVLNETNCPLTIEGVRLSDLQSGDVLVRLYASGLCHKDGIMLAGHSGTQAGVDAHLAFIPAERWLEWIVCNYNGNLFQLAEKVILEGGHVAIGLGDYPYTELGQPTNAALVRKVRQQAQALGREVASVEEASQMLGVHSRSLTH